MKHPMSLSGNAPIYLLNEAPNVFMGKLGIEEGPRMKFHLNDSFEVFGISLSVNYVTLNKYYYYYF